MPSEREVKLVVELSDGRKVTFDLTIPGDSTPMRTTFHDTATPALRWGNGGWQCWSYNVAHSKLLGYCCQHRIYLENVGGPTWEELQRMPGAAHFLPYVGPPETWDRDRLTRLRFRHKYHWEGHATEQEAIACYRRFLFDQSKSFILGDTEQACSGCGRPTRQRVDFDSPMMWPIPQCNQCASDRSTLKALCLSQF